MCILYLCGCALEMMRQQQRELRKTNRELERDRGGLERQERQLVSGGGQWEEGEEKSCM